MRKKENRGYSFFSTCASISLSIPILYLLNCCQNCCSLLHYHSHYLVRYLDLFLRRHRFLRYLHYCRLLHHHSPHPHLTRFHLLHHHCPHYPQIELYHLQNLMLGYHIEHCYRRHHLRHNHFFGLFSDLYRHHSYFRHHWFELYLLQNLMLGYHIEHCYRRHHLHHNHFPGWTVDLHQQHFHRSYLHYCWFRIPDLFVLLIQLYSLLHLYKLKHYSHRLPHRNHLTDLPLEKYRPHCFQSRIILWSIEAILSVPSLIQEAKLFPSSSSSHPFAWLIA